MREISLDTETTGLSHAEGDRIVEIGCVELDNLLPTGRTFHVYIDPQRSMSAGASEITGITDDQLRGKPVFAKIADDFLKFISGAKLVIHNAAFDIGFLNSELQRLNKPLLTMEYVIDTLQIARKRYPGAQSSLDALCRRFGVDNTAREKHGALLDAEILAEVYLHLRGGRQPGLTLASIDDATAAAADDQGSSSALSPAAKRSGERPKFLQDDERVAHRAFVEELGDDAIWNSIWREKATGGEN